MLTVCILQHLGIAQPRAGLSDRRHIQSRIAQPQDRPNWDVFVRRQPPAKSTQLPQSDILLFDPARLHKRKQRPEVLAL